MDQQRTPVTVSVRNLGGIDSRELTFDPGVTVLTGRNATNRTSFLRALSAALGGSDGELKGDADEGRVELTVDGTSAVRRFERDGDAVRTSGDPYTDDTAVVDAFSCLLATNPARRAVERGDGDALRDVVMRPVDTEDIRSEIERRQREVRTTTDRLADLEREVDRLPDLRERLADRREEREAVVDDIESVRTAIDEFEADVDAAEAAEAVVDELTDARNEFESVRDRLETQRTALESLEDERETVAAALDESTAPAEELEAARAELERLQGRQRELENSINNLVSIVEFNEELVEEADDLPGEALSNEAPSAGASTGAGLSGEDPPDEDGAAGAGTVIDELDPVSREVECWTCGTRVERDAIATRIAALRDVVEEKRAERADRRAEIADLRERVDELQSAVEDHESLSSRLADIDDEIDRRESRIADLEERADDLRDRIDDLEERASESEGLRDSELLARYKRLSELEYERGQLDEAIASLGDDVAEAERSRDERDRLAAELEDHEAALSDLRGRIAALEREAVETFNDHMATLLDLLDYANVERVWIERKTSADGDEVAPESTFDLHVVRSTPAGTVYEDTVDHLSESEREVIGLVVALAGYLVHDVHETVPFVLLDSLEAIDADRIARLVDYFAEFAPYLVVALLPEDAQALPSSHERIVMDGAVA